jgi:hypothetical protein
MNFEDRIKDLIDNNFCVVGNSPIELGKKKGSIIDEFKTVIRFNDFSNKYVLDYGLKTNVWVRASNDIVIETLNTKLMENFDYIYIRAKRKENEDSAKYLISNKKAFDYFPIDYEIKLSKEIKSIPSTGLLFLYILKENGFKITNNNIFGFSFFSKKDLEMFKTHHYFDPKSKLTIGINKARHNWDKEKDYFNTQIIGR